MKTACALLLIISISTSAFAQVIAKPDTIVPGKGSPEKQLKVIKEKDIKLHSDSVANVPKKAITVDTTTHNKYNELLNDDPAYNKKYHWLYPAGEVMGINVLTWGLDHYILNADYANIGPATWSYNIKTGWEWDNDRFGINFSGHQYLGSLFFSAARTSGYDYYHSLPFAIGGSLMYEYFGENTLPSYNDFIITPITGAFLGEILYRLSSGILDDRTRGRERVVREILAGVVDPVRGFNRLLQGKSFRNTNKEIYQKEPINITFYGGFRQINYDTKFQSKGQTNAILDLQVDYGNAFENRPRKPFDLFLIRTGFNFGAGRKILDNIQISGILTGKNFETTKKGMLIGAFQYYDYWDNGAFELSALGFGGGIITQLNINKKSNLYTSLHLAGVPLAGSSTRYGPDTTQVRDYNYSSGLEGKFEVTLDLNQLVNFKLSAYYYWTHPYVGQAEDNFEGIIRPRVTLQILKNLSIGYEHFIYTNDRYSPYLPDVHLSKTEDKLFLLLYIEDPKRKGRYN